jgi:hypothetical protein
VAVAWNPLDSTRLASRDFVAVSVWALCTGTVACGGTSRAVDAIRARDPAVDAAPVERCYARFGDARRQVPTSLSVDEFGNVVVVGWFEGTLDFGGTPLDAGAGTAMFIASFDSDCRAVWSRAFESPPVAPIVAARGEGVVVVGDLGAPIDLGGGTFASGGGADFFVLGLAAASGSYRFSRAFGGPGQQFAQGVALDARGNAIIVGSFEDSMDLGGGPLSSAGSLDTYVLKLDTEGHHVFSHRFGGPSEQRAEAVAVSDDGAATFTGFTRDAIDFGGGLRAASPPATSIFAAKVDANGDHVWSAVYGTGAGHAVATDSVGNTILAGEFVNADFGGGALASKSGASFFTPQTDAYITKLSPHGSYLWTRRTMDAWPSAGFTVAAEQDDNLVVSAWGRQIDFSGDGSSDASAEDGWVVVELDPLGDQRQKVWISSAPSSVNGSPPKVAASPSGTMLTYGFQGSVDFGRGLLTSAGLEDVALVLFTR